MNIFKLLKNGYDIYENGIHVKDKYNAEYWDIGNDGVIWIRVNDGTEYGTLYELIEDEEGAIEIIPRKSV